MRSVSCSRWRRRGRQACFDIVYVNIAYVHKPSGARPSVRLSVIPPLHLCLHATPPLSVTRSLLLCYIHGPDPGLHHCVYNATFGYNIATGKHCSVRPARQSDKHPVDSSAGSGPPPLNSSTFRPVVGQLSEVVPFLLLQQRCGMACQTMLRQPRRSRCSKTG